MKRILIALPLIALVTLTFSGAAAQTTSLAGDWTGESICFGNNPSCHDEKVLYHISIDSSDSTKVKIAADKIVDGKPDPMGDIDLKYDQSKQTLTGETQTPRYRLRWEFNIKGNIIEGGLYVLPDRATGRKIRVQKNESNKKEPSMTQHATGTFEVKMTPADDKSEDKTLGRMTIAKEWHGDLEGTSVGQMLSGGDVTKGSAGYVAIEKFTGTLNGRKGSFILQHSGTMTRGVGQLTITVVPDSGTDQLKGIGGKLGIKIENGKHSYEFDYSLE
jgi:Protein of unknown function (DUF3224)